MLSSRAMEASAAMDGESEADMQGAEAGRAEANVRREGLGSHEPARDQRSYTGRRLATGPRVAIAAAMSRRA
ncbi:MAG: hypothetical protein EBR28_13980 [Planctomycetia bacterium]|nr:hypothetical protein [Planctomycetia bacterium]